MHNCMSHVDTIGRQPHFSLQSCKNVIEICWPKPSAGSDSAPVMNAMISVNVTSFVSKMTEQEPSINIINSCFNRNSNIFLVCDSRKMLHCNNEIKKSTKIYRII